MLYANMCRDGLNESTLINALITGQPDDNDEGKTGIVNLIF